MRFKQWLLSEKTLYHGTVVDNESNIRKYGLQGGWHDSSNTFVGDSYDDEYASAGVDRTEEDDVVFLTDKQALDKAVTAMVFHISKKLGVTLHDVSDNDIRNHGLLVIVKDEDDDVQAYDPEDPNSDWAYNPPRGAETGDYIVQSAGGDGFLRGAALIRFLQRHGQWPRNWGPHDPNRDKIRRGQLGRMAVQRVTDKPKDDVIQTIRNADPKDVEDQLKAWR